MNNKQKKITNLNVMQKELRLLKKKNEELERFVYSASHDLKAPLRSIMGIVSIAKTTTRDDTQLKYLDMISRSVFKLDNFIADLVRFSRNTSTKIKSENINFQELIDDTVEDLSHMEGSSDVNIATKISEGNFYSDTSRVKIIFGNLISNAFKYQRRENKVQATLSIRVELTKDNARLIFQDNGEGIDKTNYKNIFKMFYRASESSHGSGLGLYIVSEVVKKLRGKIKVESEKGKGTIFSLTLPNIRNNKVLKN